jgi:flagellar hook-basal body complex protein FliE
MNGIESSSIQAMVAQIKTMAAQARLVKEVGGAEQEIEANGKVNFGDVLKSTLERVGASQKNADDLGRRFTLGDDSVNISDVMIAGQKANIALQATLQVRNRLVSAYHDIMNMSI